MRIQLEDTQALIIDYQEKLVPVIYNKEQLIKNSTKLIKGLQVLNVPMMVTQQYTKGLGMTVNELAKEIKEFHFYEKISFSCYKDKEINTKVKEMNKKNIILCGIEAHICVLQTAIDLLEDHYNVILVEDCIASRKENDKIIALKRLEKEGVTITSYESILFELMNAANHPIFKQISALVK